MAMQARIEELLSKLKKLLEQQSVWDQTLRQFQALNFPRVSGDRDERETYFRERAQLEFDLKADLFRLLDQLCDFFLVCEEPTRTDLRARIAGIPGLGVHCLDVFELSRRRTWRAHTNADTAACPRRGVDRELYHRLSKYADYLSGPICRRRGSRHGSTTALRFRSRHINR
jgi:hypothetical protein